jgi:hypothetical protein
MEDVLTLSALEQTAESRIPLRPFIRYHADDWMRQKVFFGISHEADASTFTIALPTRGGISNERNVIVSPAKLHRGARTTN